MPIRYAEITIIKNLKEESMLRYFNRTLLGNENSINDNDTIIILFDDETIYDTKPPHLNKPFSMGIPSSSFYGYPIYFEIKDNNECFFLQRPSIIHELPKLNFNLIFSNNPKFSISIKEPSIYNIIYYTILNKNKNRGEHEAFAIVKIKSNEEKPRFLLAYDEENFNKNDIIYFVNYIFKCQFYSGPI